MGFIKTSLTKEEYVIINNKLEAIVKDVVKEIDPYYHISGEESFINKVGTISYDYSGRVEKANAEKIIEIYNNCFNKDKGIEWYTSKLDYFLNNLYIDSWTPSYNSNYGKHWICFKEIIEGRYKDFYGENYKLIDEEDNFNEELYENLEDIFNDFINTFSIEKVYNWLIEEIE